MALAAMLAGCSSSPSAPGAQPATTSTSAGPSTTAASTSTAPAPATPTTVVTSLPLGDGKRSTAAEAGSVLACQTTFGPAGGAFRDGPWITGSTWNPSAKINVLGAVAWPQAQYSVERQGANRVITTNGVPAQSTTGIFPVAADDPAYQYDRNPNRITPSAVTYMVPAAPVAVDAPRCVNMGAIGVLADGVVLFNALDALGRDAAAHEVLDRCDGHPERTGQYHRHTVPSCMLTSAGAGPTLVGYALDGFGIYVERRPDGALATNAELDACHGRVSAVPWDGSTVTMYHYVATAEYPYTVGCYRGTPTATR